MADPIAADGFSGPDKINYVIRSCSLNRPLIFVHFCPIQLRSFTSMDYHGQPTKQLDENTKERSNLWGRFVIILVNTRLAEDRISLEDWVSNSLQNGMN